MLVRIQAAGNESGTKFSGTLLLCGGSNLKHTIPYLQASGLVLLDLTIPGWVPSKQNITALCEKIHSTDCPSDAIIIADLFGNATYRYMDFVGT